MGGAIVGTHMKRAEYLMRTGSSCSLCSSATPELSSSILESENRCRNKQSKQKQTQINNKAEKSIAHLKLTSSSRNVLSSNSLSRFSLQKGKIVQKAVSLGMVGLPATGLTCTG